jgi:L,D-transpeptidase YcbB
MLIMGNRRTIVVKGLAIIFLIGLGNVCLSAPASAQNTTGVTAALGAKLDSATLLAREIEVQMEALQAEWQNAQSKSYLHQLSPALIDFYAEREYRPVWDKGGRLEQLISALETLENDGLNPDDYQIAHMRLALPMLLDDSVEAVQIRVSDELRATQAYLLALYHLYNGKVDSEGSGAQWSVELQDLSPIGDVVYLAQRIEAGEILSLFEQTRPNHLIYRSLKAGLQHYRQLKVIGGWPSLPVGSTIKPCAIDPQVALLRQRLKVTGEYVVPPSEDGVTLSPAQKCLIAKPDSSLARSSEGKEGGLVATTNSAVSEPAVNVSSVQSSSAAPVNPDEVFDEYLVDAVKKFQAEQYLEVDGAIGPATRAALNISVQARIDQIRVNLDRARWLLHNIPPEMLLVDVAGFKVTYFKASQPIWRSRVQVGMAYRTTPIFKSEVNYITLNPTWTVPPTILRKDVLPKVRENVNYLRERNIRVLDSSGQEVDPASIDWHRPGNITLRQDAGDDAALGKAVIRFPNTHAVYLHDTPHQKLFNKSQRAFSSGCIRVERALELVELLLAETPAWDSAAINKALATGKTRNVTLAKRVPILLAYWTVDAIDETRIAFKPDIYARDATVLAALNERR